MRKRKRKINIRAVACLTAICIIMIVAAWFLINKFTEHEENPTIVLKSNKITLEQGVNFDIEKYISSVKDQDGNALQFSDTESVKGTYWLNEKIDTDKPATYELIIYALDKNNNLAESKLTIIVKKKNNSTDKPTSANKPSIDEKPTETAKPSSNNDNKTNQSSSIDSGGYPTSADPYHCEPYYVKGILLVNKRHPLPPDYGGLDTQAAQALEQLQNAAASEGYSMPTLSAYRSYDYQGTLYNNYVARDGQAAADTYSARPGFSEHQSGLAFDVGAIDNDYGATPAGKWLYKHCHEYGFILRYPQGKENITGYMYEPWHIRYVGKAVAAEIYHMGVTLEEYLGDY